MHKALQRQLNPVSRQTNYFYNSIDEYLTIQESRSSSPPIEASDTNRFINESTNPHEAFLLSDKLLFHGARNSVNLPDIAQGQNWPNSALR
jgi:hypothetical protein